MMIVIKTIDLGRELGLRRPAYFRFREAGSIATAVGAGFDEMRRSRYQ
jgi:hypothetical protein